MLFREKFTIFTLFIVAIILLFDQMTQAGNHWWEKHMGSPARYAVMQKGKVGYINGRGRLVVPMVYDDGTAYSDQGPILVRSNGAWGYIDREGTVIVAPQYSWAKDFSQGLAAVAHKDAHKALSDYGFIDINGKEIVPLKFSQARSFTEDRLAAVKDYNLWGFVNTYGDLIISPTYEAAGDFHENLAPVRLNGKWGYINYAGRMLIKPQFDDAGEFSQGIAPAKTKGLWGYIDVQGRWVVNPTFTQAKSLVEGFGVVKFSGQMGFINKEGKIVFQSSDWEELKDFSDGLAAVKVAAQSKTDTFGRWGYIDRDGKWIFTPQFDWAGSFHGGLARIGLDRNDTLRGYVNKKGILIWDPADWQKSTLFRKNFSTAMFVLIVFYIILLLRYIYWFRKIKKEEAASLELSSIKEY